MKSKFYEHRQNARQRNIEFTLTYDEWYDIWQKSGHWSERGRGPGKYVMCRYGDIGPYAIGNVYIDTQEHNGYMANIGTKQTQQHSINISKALKGKKKSPEHNIKNSLGQLNRPKQHCPHCNKLISGMGNVKQHIVSKHGMVA